MKEGNAENQNEKNQAREWLTIIAKLVCVCVNRFFGYSAAVILLRACGQ